MVPVIGLDIGGANTKAAVVDGEDRITTVSEPFEVWREPEGLAAAIAAVVSRLGAGRAPVALTTTAELCDVFASKREGVLYVLAAARRALPGRRLRVMTTAGELVELGDAVNVPLACAAGNWMATALLVACSLPDAILLDCGGTTTDLIPIVDGQVAARGRTDLERLRAGELVYTGALRTNLAAALSHVPIGGEPCPVSSELFAISADAHLLRGNLTPAQCTCSFPDDRGTSLPEVRSRLARVVCADPEQLAARDLDAIAAAVEEAQVSAIAVALARVAARVPARTGVIAVGVGAFLARAAVERCALSLLPPPRSPSSLDGRGGEVAAAVALSLLGRG